MFYCFIDCPDLHVNEHLLTFHIMLLVRPLSHGEIHLIYCCSQYVRSRTTYASLSHMFFLAFLRNIEYTNILSSEFLLAVSLTFTFPHMPVFLVSVAMLAVFLSVCLFSSVLPVSIFSFFLSACLCPSLCISIFFVLSPLLCLHVDRLLLHLASSAEANFGELDSSGAAFILTCLFYTRLGFLLPSSP
jgi:hypothetical protein